MKTIESYVLGKKSNSCECEDLISVTDDFVAIFDGVSSKSNIRYHGKTTGRIAVELMSKALNSIPPEASAIECLRNINHSVYLWYESQGIIDDAKTNPQIRPAASVAIYSRINHQVWVLGDCQVFFDYKPYTFRLKIDELYIGIRMKILDYLKEIGKTTVELQQNDISALVLRPLMEIQPFLQNSEYRNDYSYSILDGFDFYEDDLHVLQVPKTIKEVCLATDGYPIIFGSLTESENYLKHILVNDPLCCNIFKHFTGVSQGHNSFDDRAYVRFSIE